MTPSPLDKLAYEERTRREILVKSELIPPLPDVVVRVLALLNDSNTEPKDLEQHLHCDPVLVARMLALVNSPFYGVAHQVKTIKDAVMVLGFRGLRSLLLASGTAKFLQRDYRCYGHGNKGLWKHSLAVASCAKTLAKRVGFGPEEIEEMFVVGLLHDIGKMLLAPYLTEKKIAVEQGKDVADVERRAIGLDHTEAGELVVTKWGLSPVVKEALRQHHNPVEQLTAPIAIVRVADSVAHQIGVGYEPESEAPSQATEAEMLEFLELQGTDWEDTRQSMEEAVRAALTQLASLSS